MKRIILSMLTIAFSFAMATSQKVTISPIPKSVTWGEEAFSNSSTFVLDNNNADTDAVKLLKNNMTISNSGDIHIVIGEKNDTNIEDYTAEIPNKGEGYLLKITPTQIVIAGNDEAGTYYGVQSLLQIMQSPKVMQTVIKDYPTMPERGVVEGFYGNPFSHQDRLEQFKFYGQNKLNTYIYGPKDDPYHGFGPKWREEYPADKAEKIKELIDVAHENKVQFVWAVHPGRDIQWNNADRLATINKFQAMYDLGVRSFAVFFDDIGGDGTDPTRQANYMNYLTNEFVKKHDDVAPLILCPTQYNQAWSGGDYLDILGNVMYPEIRIMWTGKSVVRMIDYETMTWINARIKRKAYIWLNYPVNDYVIDHLLMGATYGNAKNIGNLLSGFTANPMEYAEASKVSLYSIADYAWNPINYNANQSWDRALHFLMPSNYEAFKIFCENNVDLGATAHGLRRKNESVPFAKVATPFMTKLNAQKYDATLANQLHQQFQSFRDASAELLTSTYNTRLIKEITPWLQVFDIMGQKGELLVDMYQNLHQKDSVKFVENYLEVVELDKKQKTIISRGFQGSIKSPNPKPANEVVSPFLKEFQNRLVAEYRKKYNYRNDAFPDIILSDGRYHIKVNGKYLTNNGGNHPVLVTELNNTNPQRQEWHITIDPSTNRYKIVNAQESKYVNELGNFGTNPYDATWNTYYIYRFNGKYVLQNGGRAGDKIWTTDDNRLMPSNKNKIDATDFIFEIEEIGKEQSFQMIVPENTYYIKNNGKYLTNTNIDGNGGAPQFQSKVSDSDKQLWRFSEDPDTHRFKLVSTADNRYVNELGDFGTNDYFPTWNTYVLTELGGKFAIQNGGEAKYNYWAVWENRIHKGNATREESYIFEIVLAIPSSVDNIPETVKYTLSYTNNALFVSGITVKKIQLYSTNGALIISKVNSNKLSIENVKKGVYILSITTTNGNIAQQKVSL